MHIRIATRPATVAVSTFLSLVIAVGFGQVVASLSEVKAIVFDETGAVIPDSEIVFRSDSGTVVSHTGMDGSVKLTLPSGTYAVTTSKVGFVKSKMLDVQIVAPMPNTLRVILKVDHTPTDGAGMVEGVPTAASDLPSKIQPDPSRVPSAQPAPRKDCSTLKYLRHKVSCLCGTVQICSGDICGHPSDYDLDDDITVELRDRRGTILESKEVVSETREKQGTTQDGTKTSYKETERRFCFDGKRDGDYLLAFILHKKGASQPAVTFPTNYSHKRSKSCDSVYMVEPICPK